MEYNMDTDARDMILFGERYDKEKYLGGCRRFDGIDTNTMEMLIENGFLNPDDRQNSSPSADEFLEFMREHENYYVFGYAISPDRSDYRVTIEGICSDVSPDKDTMEDFIMNFRFADDFAIDPPYAWYD